jgi:hypothetical protein
MTSSVSGKVVFANGRVAEGVEVRIFDRDAPGKGDDDLTLTPGLSNARGEFIVHYDPGRFRDFVKLSLPGLNGAGLTLPDPLDVLTPYLRFRYSFQGEEHIFTANIGLFQNDFTLPEAGPLDFRPSRDAFQFPNTFPGFELPFSMPFLKGKTRIADPYGLCGGMSAAVSDFFLANRPIPGGQVPPARGRRLYRYLFRRAIDSFKAGATLLRFIQWMLLPDDTMNGIQHLTLKEFEKVRDALSQHRLVPIGLVYYRPPSEKDGRQVDKGEQVQIAIQNLSQNHQVLAYGIQEQPDGAVHLQIYDPNGPGQDEVYLSIERVQINAPGEEPLYGLRCRERNLHLQYKGNEFIHEPVVYGFFEMPYDPIDPPERL